jgi:apolipoprotein N-acyltransferase
MFPPYNLWLFGFVYFSALYRACLAAKGPRQAFRRAWIYSFATNIGAYVWLVHPFSFIGLGWLGWIAMPAGAAFLALYGGLAGMAAKRGALAFAAAWALAEWARGWLFSGFPWNPVAAVWSETPAVLQALSLAGTYGLSFLSVFVFVLRRSVVPSLAALGVLAFGLLRMEEAASSGRKVRIANLESETPLNSDPNNIFRLALLSKAEGWEDVDLFVWPESAIAADPTIDTGALSFLAAENNLKSAIAFGFNRHEIHDGQVEIFNSMGVVSRAGIQAVYDKKHLVPFGEFVPWRWFLPIKKFTEGMRDFSPGEGPFAIEINGSRAAALICYEIIFPGLRLGSGEEYIITISNDVWFGESGKAQHYALAKMRAAEEGVPVVRAANSGFSAVIDPYGREAKALRGQGVLDADMPRRIGRTPFSRTGNLPIAMLLILIVAARRKK